MTDFQREVISVIRSSLSGEKAKVSDSFDLNRLYSFSESQQIQTLIFSSIGEDIRLKDDSIYTKFFTSVCRAINISEQQQHELGILFNTFEKSGIDYLPIKGIVMKKLYPAPEYRSMSDADILVCKEQSSVVDKIMSEAGYTHTETDDNVTVWEKGCVVVELHVSFVPTDSDLYDYYGGGEWDIAVRDSGTHFSLKNEDFFIATLLHFVKHLRESGAGIRNICDFYILFKAYPELDRNYLIEKLKSFDLDVFYGHLIDVVNCWFADGEETDAVTELTDIMFRSGTYGIKSVGDSTVNAQYMQRYSHAKLVKLYHMAFFGKDRMRREFPILCKAPYLMPFCRIAHWCDVILHRRETLKDAKRSFDDMSLDAMNKRADELDRIGLKLYFSKNNDKV